MITPQLTEQYGQVLRVSVVRSILSVLAWAYAGATSKPNADNPAPPMTVVWMKALLEICMGGLMRWNATHIRQEFCAAGVAQAFRPANGRGAALKGCATVRSDRRAYASRARPSSTASPAMRTRERGVRPRILACAPPEPRRMLRQRPSFVHGSANHRLKGPGDSGRRLVDMDGEADQHHQAGDVARDVADRDRRAAERSREPQRDAGGEEHARTGDDRPEVQLLAGVEEADILRVPPVGVGDVTAKAAQPARIVRRPRHQPPPVEDLTGEHEHEPEAKPGMQHPHRRAAGKERRDPAKQPRRVDAEACAEAADE